jgi:hypothetical protein
LALRTLIVPLVPLFTPFHKFEMDCPLASPSVTFQALIVLVPLLVTVTSAWNPPGHEFTSRYAARQPPGWPGLVDVVLGGWLVVVVVDDGGRLVVVVVLDGGFPAFSAARTASYAGFLLPLPSNSRGVPLARQESGSRMPHTVMPAQRATARQALTTVR